MLFSQRFGRYVLPPTFFWYLSNSGTFTELRTTSFIESTGVTCSDSVSHNRVQVLSIPVVLLACSQDWARNLQMRTSREPTPITVTPCVLQDNSEWIFGTCKLTVLTWLELLLLCIIFYLCSYSDFFSHLTFLIISSHIAFNSILGLLSRSLLPNICADSLRRLILQCSALSIFSTLSHKADDFPFPSIYGPPYPTFQ